MMMSIIGCVAASSPQRKLSSGAAQDLDDSFVHLSLSPLNISPLLLPASGTKSSPPQSGDKRMMSSWDTPHAVELIRKPGDSLGISIVGGLLC